MALVLVDVDGTLLVGTSSEARFVVHLARSGLIGPRQVGSALAFLPRWAARFGGQIFKKNKAYLAGLDMDAVAAAAARFVETDLSRRLRPNVVRRLERHFSAGDQVALITGTPDFLAEPLAATVGAPWWRGTLCAVDDGVFTAEPPMRHPFADDKVAAAEELCGQVGMTLNQCWAYADAVHDLALLRRVAWPVAVAPDASLERIARAEGWEILADDEPDSPHGLTPRHGRRPSIKHPQ